MSNPDSVLINTSVNKESVADRRTLTVAAKAFFGGIELIIVQKYAAIVRTINEAEMYRFCTNRRTAHLCE